MERREVLRLLATGTALHLAPLNMVAFAREAKALLAEQTSARTLNPHQDVTVKVMAELIIPRTDTPGATDVGVANFIDLVLTEWCDEADRARFLKGLADVDSRANNLFGKNFITCAASQQSQILIDLGQKMVENGASSWVSTGLAAGSGEDFYAMFRRLTLTAYYTSEDGATKELNFEIIPGDYRGCDMVPGGKEAVKQP